METRESSVETVSQQALLALLWTTKVKLTQAVLTVSFTFGQVELAAKLLLSTKMDLWELLDTQTENFTQVEKMDLLTLLTSNLSV
jgi:hypothetical protein